MFNVLAHELTQAASIGPQLEQEQQNTPCSRSAVKTIQPLGKGEVSWAADVVATPHATAATATRALTLDAIGFQYLQQLFENV